MEQISWSLLLLDEAHMLKNEDADVTTNVTDIRKRASRVAFITGVVLLIG